MWRYILAAAITAVIMLAIYGPRHGRAAPSTFEWSGPPAHAGWVNVRNSNGAIRIESADDGLVEVVGRISAGRRNHNMRVAVREHDGALYVCPVMDGGRCGPDGYSQGRSARGLSRLFGRGSSPRVDLTVKVPGGVSADANTANGTLLISGVHGEARARTVNGRITVEDVVGPVTARSTNGSIRVRLDSVPTHAALNFRTTNGSVTAELPASLSADVDLATTNGRINSQFPVMAGGEISSRRFRGRIGDGGRELSMRTTNGSITLRPIGGAENTGAIVDEESFDAHIERMVEDALQHVEVRIDSLNARKAQVKAGAVRVEVDGRKVTVSP